MLSSGTPRVRPSPDQLVVANVPGGIFADVGGVTGRPGRASRSARRCCASGSRRAEAGRRRRPDRGWRDARNRAAWRASRRGRRSPRWSRDSRRGDAREGRLTRVRDQQFVADLPAARIGGERDGRSPRPVRLPVSGAHAVFAAPTRVWLAEIQQPVAPLKRIADVSIGTSRTINSTRRPAGIGSACVPTSSTPPGSTNSA